jgi:hypothetical protein
MYKLKLYKNLKYVPSLSYSFFFFPAFALEGAVV